jgi:site-specific DNA recombinase
MKKFISYTRYSSILQNQTSIERQDEANEKTASRENGIIVKKFSDVAKSGKQLAGRTSYIAMLNMAKEHAYEGVDGIIIEDFRRWGRNLGDSLEMYAKILKLDLPIHTQSGVNHPLMHMTEMFQSQSEIEYLAKNIKARHNLMTKEGRWIGVPPYGYDKQDKKDGGRLIINTEESSTVELIFKLWNKGKGTRLIIKELNLLNIKPRRATIFSTNIIRKILSDPTYAGYVTRNKVTHSVNGKRRALPPEEWMWSNEPVHHAFISLDEWEKNRERLSAIKAFPGKKTAKYPLTGRITCGVCGRCYIHKVWSHHKSQDVYGCSTALLMGRANCPCPNVSARQIERWVFGAIKESVLKPDYIKEKLMKENQERDTANTIENMEESLKMTMKGLENLTRSIVNMGGSDMLEAEYKKQEKKAKELEQRIQAAKKKKAPTQKDVVAISKRFTKHLNGNVGQQRKVLDELSASVTIYPETVELWITTSWWDENFDEQTRFEIPIKAVKKRLKRGFAKLQVIV